MEKHNRSPKICFVSSSGGHWDDLMRLEPLAKKYNSFFVTEKTKFENKNCRYFMLQTDLKDKLMPLKMLWNGMLSLRIWLRERPDFVITTGTMIAYPFYLLAILTRKKFIFIETFGSPYMPTIASRKMVKHSDLFIVQWESLKKFYQSAVYVGNLY